jgi:hypothetical protein
MGNINPPGKSNIKKRFSTITSEFARAKAPYQEKLNQEALAIRLYQFSCLGPVCAYCGKEQTEWDHLYPMLYHGQWTGYFTEINNLIPACSKCNQSKGNSEWENWMRSPPKHFVPVQTDETKKRILIIRTVIETYPPNKIEVKDIENANVIDLEEEYTKQLETIRMCFEQADKTATLLQGEYQKIAYGK